MNTVTIVLLSNGLVFGTVLRMHLTQSCVKSVHLSKCSSKVFGTKNSPGIINKFEGSILLKKSRIVISLLFHQKSDD